MTDRIGGGPSALICVCGCFIEGHSIKQDLGKYLDYRNLTFLGEAPTLVGLKFSARSDPSDYTSEVKQIKNKKNKKYFFKRILF